MRGSPARHMFPLIPLTLIVGVRPYWADPRIHNLGNENPLHSLLARPATKLIDTLAYNGRDIRRELLEKPRYRRTLYSISVVGLERPRPVGGRGWTSLQRCCGMRVGRRECTRVYVCAGER